MNKADLSFPEILLVKYGDNQKKGLIWDERFEEWCINNPNTPTSRNTKDQENLNPRPKDYPFKDWLLTKVGHTKVKLMDALPMGRENGSRFRDMIRSLYEEMEFEVKRGCSIDALQAVNSCSYHSEKRATLRGVFCYNSALILLFHFLKCTIGTLYKPSGRMGVELPFDLYLPLISDQVSILAKDKGFGHEMHKREDSKAVYGVTPSMDYAVTHFNEEMSHHTLYDIKPLLLYAATFKFTRDDLSESALRRNTGDKVTP
ncbi:hypothetical protein Tco_0883797 [Tanacetum coccineum]